jgi:hypothetical protein
MLKNLNDADVVAMYGISYEGLIYTQLHFFYMADFSMTEILADNICTTKKQTF